MTPFNRHIHIQQHRQNTSIIPNKCMFNEFVNFLVKIEDILSENIQKGLAIGKIIIVLPSHGVPV